MKTLNELKAEEQNKIDDCITNNGLFFAFSAKQFEQNKTPIKEGDKYVNLFGGGYLPKSKVNSYLSESRNISEWFKNELKVNNLREQYISYELANHEAYYTGDIAETLDALGDDYTAEEVWKVYRKGYAQQEF